MNRALIDVIDWQTTVDLATGRPAAAGGPLMDMAAGLCAAHRYPGDLGTLGADWVFDTALDLNQRYAPDYMLLDVATPYFQGVFGDPAGRPALVEAIFGRISQFLEATGFTPVVVGMGDLMPLRGYVDTTDLDGLASVAGMNTRCGGIFDPSPADLEKLVNRPGIERVIARDDFRAQFGGCDRFYAVAPDWFLFAEPGTLFRGVNVGSRPLRQIARPESVLPLHTPLVGGDSLTDLPELVLSALAAGKRVALILVEGVGPETFPWRFRELSNRVHWYGYTVDVFQYLALTTGRHFVEFPYPPGYRYELHDEADAPYPFSGLFEALPAGTIGERWTGRSAAVGNRSFITHLASGTDITIECFARTLYNHGVMAVLPG